MSKNIGPAKVFPKLALQPGTEKPGVWRRSLFLFSDRQQKEEHDIIFV